MSTTAIVFSVLGLALGAAALLVAIRFGLESMKELKEVPKIADGIAKMAETTQRLMADGTAKVAETTGELIRRDGQQIRETISKSGEQTRRTISEAHTSIKKELIASELRETHKEDK